MDDKKKESERKIELLNKEIENLRVEARKPANYDVIIRWDYHDFLNSLKLIFRSFLSQINTIYILIICRHSELATKEEKLRLLESEQIYNERIHDQESSKREKLIKKINYQLNKATSLKKEAFTRVEELQDQVTSFITTNTSALWTVFLE